MRILLAAFLVVVSAVSAVAENRWMSISNDTGVTMLRFYASNRGSTSWGRDWLGSDVLRSGYYIDLNFDDGTGYCMWDFKAEFSDGDTVESMSVNVCAESTWQYY